jgi:rod shape-determining protein MreD
MAKTKLTILNNFPIKKYAIYFGIGLILCLLQISAVSLISIGPIVPDLVLILVIYIAINEGQFVGLIAAFILGLMFDFFTLDLIGANILAKSTAALLAGFFHREEGHKQITTDYKFLLILFLCSFLHNSIYGIINISAYKMNFVRLFLEYAVGASIYTAVMGIFPYVYESNKSAKVV